MAYQHLTPPSNGSKITIGSDGKLKVPDQPILPFIEGDGTGPDIWRASVRVLDAAVEKAYGGKRKIVWFEVYAGEKSFNKFKTGEPEGDAKAWLPEDTLTALGPVNHAHRRRYYIAQRCTAPALGPLRLPSPCALVQGRPQPCQTP
jgi:hypothetical protein